MQSGPLGAVFRAELETRAGIGGHVAPTASETLEDELVSACARGRAAFPELTVDDQAFVRHLARVVSGGGPGGEPLAALAIEDLYLACACLVRCEGAVATFEARHGSTIRGAIARVVPAAGADEARQRLLEALLVGSETSAAKIGSYAGKAPLERWLGVSAQRAALMWLRENRSETKARDAAAVEPAAGPHASPETAYIKERYRGEFETALGDALARLSERERLLLRLTLVKGVSLERVGTMFSVSHSTASRWLAATRERLLDDVKATLGAKLGTSSSELASLAGMVASRLDLSLSALLRER
jgi:RNA polymerase sigma-70 factor, ECF subfamily